VRTPVVSFVKRSRAATGSLAVALLTVVALFLTAAPPVPPHAVVASTPPSYAVAAPTRGTPGTTVRLAPAYAPGPGVTQVGGAAPGALMRVLVGLASRNPGGVGAEVAAEYAPGSGLYHDFLSPSQVAARYGASPPTVAAATGYFAGFGLTSRLLGGGTLLSVTGPTADIARAFGTTFEVYREPGGRTFVSHPTDATLPAGIPWSGVVGLGNLTLPQPLAEPSPAGAGRSVTGPSAGCSGGASGLAPCQVAGAYDESGLLGAGTNGTGERVGVVDVYDGTEPQSELASDLAAFTAAFGLPAAHVTYNYPVPMPPNLNSTSTGWGLEEALDLEWSHAAAPGASIAMTFGSDTNVGLYEAVDWLVASDRVDVISLSWGEPDVGVYNSYAGACASACNASSDGSYEVLGPVLAAAALEGITVVAASGDCGAADGTAGISTNYPASDPYVTGVGGTVLSVTAGGVWVSETAWSGNESGATSPGCVNQGGSGGGFAPTPAPSWQSGLGVPTPSTHRGVPDVAADAATPVEVVQRGSDAGVIGTSVATPLWAGATALADQYAGGPLGFLNPELYSVLRSSRYTADFHDVTTGNNSGYSAGTGWDPVTGIGTPILGQLVADLAVPMRSASSLTVGLLAAPDQGTAPLTVAFSIQVIGGSGAYPLEGVYFGDGTSALAPSGNASHTYTGPGVYRAVAFVADSSGNQSASVPVAVVVGGASLSVNLTVSDPSPSVGAVDRFNATVTGGVAPYSFQFSFGDGSSVNRSATNETAHAYPVAGGFCADVVVTDAAEPGDGGTSAAVPVAVGGVPAPACPYGPAPLTVTGAKAPGVRDAPADYPSLFTVSGGVGPTTEVLASSDPYVGACGCTIFRTPGTYSVTLTASDSAGHHAANETNVTVAPSLVATFTASATYGEAPLSVNFSASVAGGYEATAARTQWAFGDGATAFGATASHTYRSPGFYLATGDAQDSGDGNASEGFVIDVLPSGPPGVPWVAATITPAVYVADGTMVNFTATTDLTSSPVRFNWSLGALGRAFSPQTSATVNASSADAGSAREFWLNVSWPLLDLSVTVPISAPSFLAVEPGGFVPRADALALSAGTGPSYGIVPVEWSGRATASGPGTTGLAWTFGNGGTASGSTAEEGYLLPGEYTGNVTAQDSWGDEARLPFGVQVRSAEAVSVEASVSPQRGNAPLTVVVNASAAGGVGPPFGFLWSFGDGRGAATAEASVSYDTAGAYRLTLIVTDLEGEVFETNWTVVVTLGGPPSGGGTGGEPAALFLGIAAVVGGVAAAAVVLAARRPAERPPRPPTP
jgi:kumamolisin